MLGVLFAEVGAVGLNDPEQLHDHRRHAAEMAGPEPAAEMIGETADVDRALRRNRVHLLDRRGEHDVDAEPVAELPVRIERARIPPQIVLAIELQRVDEDADRDRPAFGRACSISRTWPA